ncbi:lysophosphatidylcholine acyltransferase 3 [Capsaspora owczarzaki ATCC 30864]|uniref:Lysophospholipid acyltransferase 5 n=1 Tax=Capsaspora owczarzaki (strain ATCC 30864) TaxID=595528 RepID=A0A0D2WSC9_CAPO3|nr:lysophosphatidylcholine acyltransferase 3 [Capsaspora owczarzaki ATCC 30864]KJE94333.1 lysophosphatidylcholine acyltransferase 3 [Capsaspora owczarzaki ATCC 30864]|eukprot:XP_004346677.1 lysophosphatidylcholine acyltransferase 3 [Capsaspora owczarzaki ATCC 30864]
MLVVLPFRLVLSSGGGAPPSRAAQQALHLFSAVAGAAGVFWCFGPDTLHCFLTILATYLCMLVLGQTAAMVGIVFTGIFGHLLGCYLIHATDSYDINFTTVQCVLALRLIGLAFDFYDGRIPTDKLTKDTVNSALPKLPSILEVLGYAYFWGGVFVGPQFPIRRYQAFVSGTLFKPEQLRESLVPALSRAALGLVYIGVTPVLNGYFPQSYLFTDAFKALPLLYRLAYLWGLCKAAFLSYVGVWLIAEASCMLSGLSYNVATKKWDGLANIRVWKFETATSLKACIESFNVNTNDWVARYIFKRLRFMNNKHFSSLSTLMFLALWHGFHIGYFICFLTEFVVVEIERRLRADVMPRLTPIIPAPVLNIVCYIITTSTLHYALIAFVLLSLSPIKEVYSSIYFIGHLVAVLLMMIPIPRVRHSQPETATKTE